MNGYLDLKSLLVLESTCREMREEKITRYWWSQFTNDKDVLSGLVDVPSDLQKYDEFRVVYNLGSVGAKLIKPYFSWSMNRWFRFMGYAGKWIGENSEDDYLDLWKYLLENWDVDYSGRQWEYIRNSVDRLVYSALMGADKIPLLIEVLKIGLEIHYKAYLPRINTVIVSDAVDIFVIFELIHKCNGYGHLVVKYGAVKIMKYMLQFPDNRHTMEMLSILKDGYEKYLIKKRIYEDPVISKTLEF